MELSNTLRYINLAGLAIGLVALRVAWNVPYSLASVSLLGNRINDEGAAALGTALTISRSLQKLNLGLDGPQATNRVSQTRIRHECTGLTDGKIKSLMCVCVREREKERERERERVGRDSCFMLIAQTAVQ